ncbi:hypothetical protein V5799_025183 [Amblyomma americanum]|uniref:Uncharacterized protein n=1 Tax=Amblyomma americanum TaxID=6943 RepID=A0AAQ4EAG2_AMBAM
MASRSTSRNRQNSSKNSSRLTWADRVSGNATRHPPPPQSSQKIRETRNSGPCATRLLVHHKRPQEDRIESPIIQARSQRAESSSHLRTKGLIPGLCKARAIQ